MPFIYILRTHEQPERNAALTITGTSISDWNSIMMGTKRKLEEDSSYPWQVSEFYRIDFICTKSDEAFFVQQRLIS